VSPLAFGLAYNTAYHGADPDLMVAAARHAEKCGFESFYMSEHIVMYPGATLPGYVPLPPDLAVADPLTCLAYVAAATSTLLLGTAVLLVPYHQPVVLAKQLATIDVLSGGRLTVGIGAGWLKAEFDAVVTTPFAERGAVTDEYVAAFKTLWTEKKPVIDGKYVHYDRLLLEPKPTQKPHPPIWVGGESGPSLRRAAKLGDAWYPIGTNNAAPYDSLARYKAGVARLKQLTVAAGRDADAVALTYRVKRYGKDVPDHAGDGERRLFSGSDGDIIGDIHALEDIGVTAIDFDFERPVEPAVVTEMADFRERVLAKA
jgi:probable F420-dependent oxidoreductase